MKAVGRFRRLTAESGTALILKRRFGLKVREDGEVWDYTGRDSAEVREDNPILII